MLKAAAIANPTSPAGIATRRSRSGSVITSPRLRRGVPDSQAKTSGTSVSGTSRISRSSRIHDQLLATVVRSGLIRVIDGVLDRFARGRLDLNVLGSGLRLPAE